MATPEQVPGRKKASLAQREAARRSRDGGFAVYRAVGQRRPLSRLRRQLPLRRGAMGDGKKPPLRKGRWHGAAVTEGSRSKATPQSAPPTAPLTQGSLLRGRRPWTPPPFVKGGRKLQTWRGKKLQAWGAALSPASARARTRTAAAPGRDSCLARPSQAPCTRRQAATPAAPTAPRP